MTVFTILRKKLKVGKLENSNARMLDFRLTFAHFSTLLARVGVLLVPFWRSLASFWLPFGFLGLTFGDPGAHLTFEGSRAWGEGLPPPLLLP